MAFTVDWDNKVVNSSASITDLPATRAALRALEDSAAGVLHDPIIDYKEVAIGGGAVFPTIAFVNGYTLKFPAPGNYTIGGGNLSATVVPVAGVYVERTQSAAYAVTSVGGGVTPEQVAAAVWGYTQ